MSASELEGAAWRKSSYSNGGGNCVEVAQASIGVPVRDSKDPEGPVIVIAPAAWSAFMSSVKGGELHP
ncbi:MULTISPECIES: DUF397 domain-containing protein [Streptomyces]|uniref:DUF397 domain-containing protein n=1 Tax=Streptomyces TaxID=1883 RepID=UPI000AA3FE9A